MARFGELKGCLSEYNFGTLYLFRREHDYHIITEGENIWIRGKTRDGLVHLMPTAHLSTFSSEYLFNLLNDADCFYPIPESWASDFNDQLFTKTYNRDDSDYIFKRTKIAEYPGRNLSAKRNLLKQFLDNYQAKIVRYDSSCLKDALMILDTWQSNFKGQDSDYLACKDGLELARELGLHGSIIYIEDTPAAFILGEISAAHLFVIHFAKGLTKYKGIYPYLFQALATDSSINEISCLNWEQDLGQEGLRQSKESYQPDKIAHKFRIFNNLTYDS
jgi:uncharacterized protein